MIIARGSIALSVMTDIESVTWYYRLQASTASPPAKPTTATPDGWDTIEPSYTEGSTNNLYIVQKTTFSDGTFEYSDVSLSSSYEAAKAAYNKSVQAKQTADAAQEEIDNLTIGGRNLLLGTGTPHSSMANDPQYVPDYEMSDYGKTLFVDSETEFTLSFDYEIIGDYSGASSTSRIYAMINRTSANPANVIYVKDAPRTGHYETTCKMTAAQVSSSLNNCRARWNGIVSGCTFIISNFKAEIGNRATDWTPAPEDLEQMAEDAKLVAENYVTDISGGGIIVHPEGNEEDGVKIHDAIEIIKDGITYIKLWLDGVNADQPKIQVGDSSNGAYFLIEQDRLSGRSLDHPYFETGEAGTTVKQIHRGDGMTAQFGLYRASSVTSVTVNGSAVTAYTLRQTSPTTYGSLVFDDNAIPAAGANIVIVYETTEQNPFFTFGSRDPESGLPNGTASASFGKGNSASGPCSFAEGSLNSVTGTAGHVEGDSNTVNAYAGHAEGAMNDVRGSYSHAEGYNNVVSGKYSHVGGSGNIVPYNNQMVIGCNAPQATSDDLFMAGNGDVTGGSSAAMRLKRSGRVEFAGAVGSGLTWDTRSEMISAMTALSLSRPYNFFAGATWANTAGAGSYSAFGTICKMSTTAWHMMFMCNGNIYKSVFNWNGAGTTTGTFNTSQVG